LGSEFAEAAGEDGVELAVVAVDEEEAVAVEPGGGASIAGLGVRRLAGAAGAGFDTDAFAGEPGGVERVVRCPFVVVRREVVEFAVEVAEDGGGEGLAGDGGVAGEFAAEGGGDGFEIRGEGELVEVDADADDGVLEHGGEPERSSDGAPDLRAGWAVCSMRMPPTFREGPEGWGPPVCGMTRSLGQRMSIWLGMARPVISAMAAWTATAVRKERPRVDCMGMGGEVRAVM
jgi:hypothetical protein